MSKNDIYKVIEKDIDDCMKNIEFCTNKYGESNRSELNIKEIYQIGYQYGTNLGFLLSLALLLDIEDELIDTKSRDKIIAKILLRKENLL